MLDPCLGNKKHWEYPATWGGDMTCSKSNMRLKGMPFSNSGQGQGGGGGAGIQVKILFSISTQLSKTCWHFNIYEHAKFRAQLSLT